MSRIAVNHSPRGWAGAAAVTLLLAVQMLVAPAAHAQSAVVVAACGTPPVTYAAGKTRALTQDTAGNACTSASATGTFTDDATGTTGNPVPGSASYTGVNIGGNTVGQTGYSSASGDKAAAVVTAGNSYSHIATSTTTTVKSGAGTLHTICINQLGTVASAIEVDDATSHTTPVIAVLNSLTTGQGCYTYDIAFSTGLTVVTTGAPDITVSYR